MQIGMRFGGEHHREILRAGDKILAHLAGIIRLDVKGGLRKDMAEIMDQIPDIGIGQIVLNPQPHRHRRFARWRHRAAGLVPIAAQQAGVSLKPQALGGQIGARARAGEQPRPQRGFQRLHPRRNRGLRHTQPLGGAVKRPRLDQIQKGVQQLDLHGLLRLIALADQ